MRWVVIQQINVFMVTIIKKLLLLIIFALPIASMAQHTSTLDMYTENYATGSNYEKSNLENTSNPDNNNRFWINAGLGVGTLGGAGIASTSYQFGLHLLSIRGAVTFEILGDDFWDIGMLYGLATSKQNYHASISSGMAVMGGSRSAGFFEQSEVISRQIGFPLEGQLFWWPSNVFGLGLNGFVNLNMEQTFAGLTLTLQLGKLR